MDYKKAITTLMLQGSVWVPVISAQPVADMAAKELGCEVIVAKHNYKSDYARLFVKVSPKKMAQTAEMYENIVKFKCEEYGLCLQEFSHFIKISDTMGHATYKTWREAYDAISEKYV